MERKIRDYFDSETMPEDVSRRIEDALTVHPRAVSRPRWGRVAAFAAMLVMVLMIGFNFSTVKAYAEDFLSQFFHEPQGRVGRDFAEVRDGRLYFTGNGENIDITDQCSMDTAFIYVSETLSGKTMYMIVGGTPENWGYMDFVYNPNNDHYSGSGHNTLDPDNDYESYGWVQDAVDRLNLPFSP